MQTSGKGAKSRRIFLALARVQPVLAPAKCANERKGREKPQDFLSPCPSAACLGVKNRRGTATDARKTVAFARTVARLFRWRRARCVGRCVPFRHRASRNGVPAGIAARQASGKRLSSLVWNRSADRIYGTAGRNSYPADRNVGTAGWGNGRPLRRGCRGVGLALWLSCVWRCAAVFRRFAGRVSLWGAGEAGGRLPDFLPGDGGCGRRIAYLCSRMAAKSCFRVNK